VQGHKLFFALWPDEATRARIADAVDAFVRTAAPRGRRVKTERLHMTLPFLGEFAELPPALVAAACAAAAQVRTGSFDCVLDRFGSFARAHVGWLGCAEAAPALQALFEQLVEALRAHDCHVARPAQFVPHVTVLRDIEHPIDAAPATPVRWPVDEFVLIASRPSGDYDLLARWPLRV
jgi:2'-5' RNA ligase